MSSRVTVPEYQPLDDTKGALYYLRHRGHNVVVLAVIRTTHVRVNMGSYIQYINIQYIYNACTNSADSAATGES